MAPSAIQKANPKIIQVSDRFHLIKGLSEACKKQIQMLVNANFRIPKTGSHHEGETGGIDYWEKETKPDMVTMEHEKNLYQKQQTLERVKVLNAQGLSQLEIAKEVGLSRTSVWRYLKSGFSLSSSHYDQKHASKIKPYEKTIKSMLAKRHTFKEIEKRLKEEGYTGAVSTIRMYTTRERKLLQHANKEKKEIQN